MASAPGIAFNRLRLVTESCNKMYCVKTLQTPSEPTVETTGLLLSAVMPSSEGDPHHNLHSCPTKKHKECVREMLFHWTHVVSEAFILPYFK